MARTLNSDCQFHAFPHDYTLFCTYWTRIFLEKIFLAPSSLSLSYYSLNSDPLRATATYPKKVSQKGQIVGCPHKKKLMPLVAGASVAPHSILQAQLKLDIRRANRRTRDVSDNAAPLLVPSTARPAYHFRMEQTRALSAISAVPGNDTVRGILRTIFQMRANKCAGNCYLAADSKLCTANHCRRCKCLGILGINTRSIGL